MSTLQRRHFQAGTRVAVGTSPFWPPGNQAMGGGAGVRHGHLRLVGNVS
jgi:hypothetical protein